MEIKDNRIYLTDEERKNPKKITGTRLGAILGLNNYSTPFQCFCEMTHTWEEPFEDSIYTIAGKTIEPKQAEYIRENYCKDIIYPKDIFGENYFNATHGNFFNDEHFGGMWDYLEQLNGETKCVFEMKTAGKSKMKDWAGNKIPESYALQASLYAYLLGIDKVVMVATFLNQKDGDYEHPENFIVSNDNTHIHEFNVSEKYPNFKQDYIDIAIKWWNDFIVTGISPEWDPIRDAKIINDIVNNPSPNIIPTDTFNSIQTDSIIKDTTNILDTILKNIDLDIETRSIGFTAKNYYFKLPLEIYNISCKIKNLDNLDAKNEINNKLNLAKKKIELLENYI